jgi:hypothetical protein
MSWVLIYISTNFLAPIPCILAGIDDLIFQFAPKLTNFSRSIPNRLKPFCIPEIAGPSQKFLTQKVPNRLKPVPHRLKSALAGQRLRFRSTCSPHRSPPHRSSSSCSVSLDQSPRQRATRPAQASSCPAARHAPLRTLRQRSTSRRPPPLTHALVPALARLRTLPPAPAQLALPPARLRRLATTAHHHAASLRLARIASTRPSSARQPSRLIAAQLAPTLAQPSVPAAHAPSSPCSAPARPSLQVTSQQLIHHVPPRPEIASHKTG